jgi:hypothetical protein
LQRDRFNAGLLAFRLIQDFHFEFTALGPAAVHAEQNLGPVLRFGATGAGVDFHEGIAAIGLAGEQAFDLPALGLNGQRGKGGKRVFCNPGIALGLGEFDQLQRVIALTLQGFHPLNNAGNTPAFAHQLLSRGGIVPEVRVFGAGIQFRQTDYGSIPVKDASGAKPPIARFVRSIGLIQPTL